MSRYLFNSTHESSGGHRDSWDVRLKCIEPTCLLDEEDADAIGCGWTGNGRERVEWGASDITPEECPACGGEVDYA